MEQAQETPSREFYGVTKEQLDALVEYFLNKPAKESIPYLNMLGAVPRITFKEEAKVESEFPEPPTAEQQVEVKKPVTRKPRKSKVEKNV